MKDGFLILKCDVTKESVKRNSLLIIFTSVLVLGLVAGVFSIKLCVNEDYYGIASLFKNFVSSRSGQPYYKFSFFFRFAVLYFRAWNSGAVYNSCCTFFQRIWNWLDFRLSLLCSLIIRYWIICSCTLAWVFIVNNNYFIVLLQII